MSWGTTSESTEESSDPTANENKLINIRMLLYHNPSIIEKDSTLLEDYVERTGGSTEIV